MKLLTSQYWKEMSKKRGFALMIAALISSIVLAMGAAIYDISIKQLSLSSLSRETQYAFYAADTAAECALYWDTRYAYFATTTPGGVTPKCDGQNVTMTETHGYSQPYTYPYTLTFQFSPNGFCSNVGVTKSINGSGVVSTVIHADGYNTACGSIASSRVSLQRSVELTY